MYEVSVGEVESAITLAACFGVLTAPKLNPCISKTAAADTLIYVLESILANPLVAFKLFKSVVERASVIIG